MAVKVSAHALVRWMELNGVNVDIFRQEISMLVERHAAAGVACADIGGVYAVIKDGVLVELQDHKPRGGERWKNDTGSVNGTAAKEKVTWQFKARRRRNGR